MTGGESFDINHVVNNIYSPPEIYYPRWITPALQAACQNHPIVVLTGARQVGKSTLLLSALRSAHLLNQSEVARDAQLSQATVHRYLNLLETTHMFSRVPVFASSRSTSLIKAPKLFWNDTGLAVFLSGYYQESELRQSREFGAYFETLIYHHLRALTRLMTPPGRLYFWRTRAGAEVDFVLEHGRKLLAIEIKRTARPHSGDAAGLRDFLNHHPQASGGLLAHGGREIRWLDKNILAIPWTTLTG